MSEEQQTYGQDATGLREAALEVSKAREAGESGIENPRLVAVDNHPTEQPAVDPTHDDKGLTVRQAAAERSAEVRKRLEGDEEFARAMGEIPTQEGEIDGLHNASIDQLTSAKEDYDLEIERLKELNDSIEKRASALEAEVRRTNANAAYREQQLAAVAQQAQGNQLHQLAQTRQAQLIEAFPDCLTDAQVAEVARTNPSRYAEYANTVQYIQNELKARMLDTTVAQNQLSQQQRAAFFQYASEQDATFERNHPEFQGETGKKALARLAEATVAELTEKHGVSREQIAYLYNNDPNWRSTAGQEAAIALGRERLNREAIEQKRYRRPLPVIQRPGSADTVPKVSEQRIAQLTRDLSEKQSVRAAAKLLAERRRSR